MATAVFPCEDGHAQERSLLGELLPTLVARDTLIMDRNFCARDFLHDINAREAYFIGLRSLVKTMHFSARL